MYFILRFLVFALIAYVLSLVLTPHIKIDTYGVAILFVLVLGLLNTLVKPLLVILTLPITLVTLGLFLIVLNVLMVMLAGNLIDGVHIQSFWWALAFSLMLSFFSASLDRIGRR